MRSFSIQEAQELTIFGQQTVERLSAASSHFDSAHDEASEERSWLEVATRRMAGALERVHRALLDAASLPEFASARKVKSEALSHAWADAIEGVFDAIVANVSANGPLVEALFPHQRFATLRRPGSGRCIAASTASGMTVGPGMARNSRPLAIDIMTSELAVAEVCLARSAAPSVHVF